jgi:3-oxoacyl-[acyl-carrier-protein] synthase I
MNTCDQTKLYVAGIGMITPVGGDATMTAAAVRAGISAYTVSDYFNRHFKAITATSVPSAIFTEVETDIIAADGFNEQHDRVIKMAIIALREACALHSTKQAIPLVLAMSDDNHANSRLLHNLVKNCQPWVSIPLSRSIYTGRAAGMEALAFAFDYLYNLPNDFILIGGSDSYLDDSRLNALDAADRLLGQGNANGFAPGEAAGFLLLTRHPELALIRNGHMVALNPPGIADEQGHLLSDQPYRGEGLDQAFKQALAQYSGTKIHSIYSSMNGENYWAKEYGVAFIRSRAAFQDPVKFEHPADCYGDVGSATGPILIALAAEHLFKTSDANAHLVYSSSDAAKRGAVVVEKLAVKNTVSVGNSNPAYAEEGQS